MANPRKPGKRLFFIELFGKKFDVRLVPDGHKVLDMGADARVWGMLYYEDCVIYINAAGTPEQRHTTLLHEVQHLIEEHYCIEHKEPCTSLEEAEARTDRISLGWLYFIRCNPHAVNYVRGDK